MCRGSHIATGGTGGLGLLAGRWLAQHGAHRVALASRSGVLAPDTAAEWGAIEASGASTSVERCDTGEPTHIGRLATLAPPMVGLWHAAGLLVDAVLPKQDAAGRARVYAPTAHGAWGVHAAGATSAMEAVALFSSVFTHRVGAAEQFSWQQIFMI